MTAGERRRCALFVVAHPDDAEIPAGGTIARLTDAGVRVVTAVLCMPERGEQAVRRTKYIERAADLLGEELLWPVGQRHWGVAEMNEIQVVSIVDELMTEVSPCAVFTHWTGDGHVDHRLTARATVAATRQHRVDLYSFRPAEPSTPALARFAPQVFVDISDMAERKALALEPFGVPRPSFRGVALSAVEATDRFFGALSGTDRAEGFIAERQHGLGPMLVG